MGLAFFNKPLCICGSRDLQEVLDIFFLISFRELTCATSGSAAGIVGAPADGTTMRRVCSILSRVCERKY